MRHWFFNIHVFLKACKFKSRVVAWRHKRKNSWFIRGPKKGEVLNQPYGFCLGCIFFKHSSFQGIQFIAFDTIFWLSGSNCIMFSFRNVINRLREHSKGYLRLWFRKDSKTNSDKKNILNRSLTLLLILKWLLHVNPSYVVLEPRFWIGYVTSFGDVGSLLLQHNFQNRSI